VASQQSLEARLETLKKALELEDDHDQAPLFTRVLPVLEHVHPSWKEVFFLYYDLGKRGFRTTLEIAARTDTTSQNVLRIVGESFKIVETLWETMGKEAERVDYRSWTTLEFFTAERAYKADLQWKPIQYVRVFLFSERNDLPTLGAIMELSERELIAWMNESTAESLIKMLATENLFLSRSF